MRISSGYDLIHLATQRHDGYWPTQSPLCEPKLVWCASPCQECRDLDYVFLSGSKTFCRAPATYVPRTLVRVTQGTTEHLEGISCPRAVEHRKSPGKEGTIKHASNHKTGTSKVPARAFTARGAMRRDRRRQRLITWVEQWLLSHLSHEKVGHTALILFEDRDESLTHEQLDTIATLMFHDYQEGGVK